MNDVATLMESVSVYLDAVASLDHVLTDDNGGAVFCYFYRNRKYAAHFFLSGKSRSSGAVELERCYRLRCLLNMIEKFFDILKQNKRLDRVMVSTDWCIAITEAINGNDIPASPQKQAEKLFWKIFPKSTLGS